MIDTFPFAGYPIAVMGLGVSGLMTARALHVSGAEVAAWDDDEARRAAAAEVEVPLVNLYDCDWTQHTTLVLSPGIPHQHPAPHPVAKLALDAGCEIICDVEILARTMRDASYIGITGTNGKSTTTALLGHIMEMAGREIAVGANLGEPALALPGFDEGGTYILEMSSFQLERIFAVTFDVAILLNITPDHLDRHGGLDGYIAAKKIIFHRQTDPRAAIIGIDDEAGRAIHAELAAAGEQRVVPISCQRPIEGGVYAVDGTLYDDLDGQRVPALQLDDLYTLPGVHNWQNVAAAYAAARVSGLAGAVCATAMQTFPGLAHRQELIAIIDGVSYINDSKATNADAVAKALACYDHVYWIAGGRAKAGGIDSLAPWFERIAHAFLIGEAADDFARTIKGKVDATASKTLQAAVGQAHAMATGKDAKDNAVVLLSPACASFDQFANFEERGEAFRQLVEALPGEHVDLDDVVPGVAPGESGA